MKTDNQSEKTPHPEKSGKIPASGVVSETYKEEVNPQDELGSSSRDPHDPEEPQKSKSEDIDSDPLEEADISEESIEEEEDYQNDSFDDDEGYTDFEDTDDDEFLK
jgi:hypothetical protein